MVKDNIRANTGRVDGSDAGGSPGEGEGEGGYEGEGGGGQPAAAQDAGEVEGGGRMIADYSRKRHHMKFFAGAKDGSWRSREASRGRAGQVRKSQGGTERKKGSRDAPSKI